MTDTVQRRQSTTSKTRRTVVERRKRLALFGRVEYREKAKHSHTTGIFPLSVTASRFPTLLLPQWPLCWIALVALSLPPAPFARRSMQAEGRAHMCVVFPYGSPNCDQVPTKPRFATSRLAPRSYPRVTPTRHGPTTSLKPTILSRRVFQAAQRQHQKQKQVSTPSPRRLSKKRLAQASPTNCQSKARRRKAML